jgi:hypothetical protein
MLIYFGVSLDLCSNEKTLPNLNLQIMSWYLGFFSQNDHVIDISYYTFGPTY